VSAEDVRIVREAQSVLTAYENYEGPWGDDEPKIAEAAIRMAHTVIRLEACLAEIKEEGEAWARECRKGVRLAVSRAEAAEARLARLEDDLRRAKQSRTGVYEDKLNARERVEIAEMRLAAAQLALAATEEGAE